MPGRRQCSGCLPCNRPSKGSAKGAGERGRWAGRQAGIHTHVLYSVYVPYTLGTRTHTRRPWVAACSRRTARISATLAHILPPRRLRCTHTVISRVQRREADDRTRRLCAAIATATVRLCVALPPAPTPPWQQLSPQAIRSRPRGRNSFAPLRPNNTRLRTAHGSVCLFDPCTMAGIASTLLWPGFRMYTSPGRSGGRGGAEEGDVECIHPRRASC